MTKLTYSSSEDFQFSGWARLLSVCIITNYTDKTAASRIMCDAEMVNGGWTIRTVPQHHGTLQSPHALTIQRHQGP